MKKIRLLALALCFILVLAPLTVLAEEPGYDMDPLCLKFETQADYDALITRKEECSAEIDGGALKLTAKDLGSTNDLKLPDARVYVSYKNLAKQVNAEDYPYITLIYRMPKTENPESAYANGRYFTELFCNTNDTGPRGGQSVRANPRVTGGHYSALTFNAGSLSEWKGVITSLRLDFLEWAFEGDEMYVHNILLSKTEEEAKKAADAILAETNLMTLKFNVGKHETAPESQTLKMGEHPTRPADPTAEGYVFDGWYTGGSYFEEFDFDAPLTKETTTAYAKWSMLFTVTFIDGVKTEPTTVSVKAHSAVEAPTPVREGYTFRGWYTDEALTKVYDLSSPVKNNITLYAKWEEGMYFPVTVTDGTASVVEAAVGADVTVNATVPEGMFFDKWVVVAGDLANADLTKAELTFKMPTSAVELEATFKKTVPGDANGDGQINARDITAIMRYMLGSVPAGFDSSAADYNGDGAINARDITAIMRFMLEN